MIEFKPNDRVITKSGRKGAVINSNPTDFPKHLLIQFDSEDRPLLILRSALSLDVEPVKKTRAKRVKSA